jgi:hypothetical protein
MHLQFQLQLEFFELELELHVLRNLSITIIRRNKYYLIVKGSSDIGMSKRHYCRIFL